jgi:N-acyl-phosphatidylethanolamine-hydrolysing phospholipase D
MRRALLLSMVLGCGFGGRVTAANLAHDGPPRAVPNKVVDPRTNGRLSALWVGHATVLVQMDDQFVMTDPVFTNAVGELSPRLIEPGLDAKNVPPLAAVVISHMHFDHLSFGSLEMIEDKVGVLLLPPGAQSSVPKYDFESRELDRWESVTSHGVRITAVPVAHVGGRYGVDAAFHPRAFTGWVFEYHGLSVYFGGDTALDRSLFAAAHERFPNLDLALLPICPLHPRDFMARTHMSPDEALDAFGLLGARSMLPIHYETFINSDDAPGECARVLRDGMSTRGLGDDRVTILSVGEQHVYDPKP